VTGWSARPAPTPGRSATSSMPRSASAALGPTPERSRIAGELIAPAARVIRRPAVAQYLHGHRSSQDHLTRSTTSYMSANEVLSHSGPPASGHATLGRRSELGCGTVGPAEDVREGVARCRSEQSRRTPPAPSAPTSNRARSVGSENAFVALSPFRFIYEPRLGLSWPSSAGVLGQRAAHTDDALMDDVPSSLRSPS
jgi:hypothetical protein